MRKIIFFFALIVSPILFAQEDFSDVEVEAHHIKDNLYYLSGRGGNIGVSIGEDGVFLIDDQFAPLTSKILDAVAGLTDDDVRFVINTHHHPDHVGGNQNLGREGAVIIAHENVRDILVAGMTGMAGINSTQGDTRLGLPVVTFADAVQLHVNGDTIHVFHIGPGHTGGDSFVYFEQDNIVHTGDVFRTTSYPRVDTGAGGSFHGIVESYESLLSHTNADTLFLPGHGELSTQAELKSQLDMFNTIKTRVQNAMNQGMSLAQIKDGGLTDEFDDRWGDGDGFVEVIYYELLGL